MNHEKTLQSVATVAHRSPPGDRWSLIDSEWFQFNNSHIFESLTDTLEEIYQHTGDRIFLIDASVGTISIVSSIKHEVVDKKYSLYDET